MRKRDGEIGSKRIQFSSEDTKKYLDAANDSMWEALRKRTQMLQKS
jgi:hypothetical protein